MHNTYWGGTFKYGSKTQKAIDHIWEGHSYTNRKPGVKSYFESTYSTPAKIKTLVQDAIAKGAKEMVERPDGSFEIIVEMAEHIGYDQANHATKWMTVIIDKAQDNIPRVRNSFPGKL